MLSPEAESYISSRKSLNCLRAIKKRFFNHIMKLNLEKKAIKNE